MGFCSLRAEISELLVSFLVLRREATYKETKKMSRYLEADPLHISYHREGYLV